MEVLEITMTQYNREELQMLNQCLFALFLVADFALLLFFKQSPYPWFALLGSGIGLAIIVLCWTGSKYILFIASLLVFSITHTLIYNWSEMIH